MPKDLDRASSDGREGDTEPEERRDNFDKGTSGARDSVPSPTPFAIDLACHPTSETWRAVVSQAACHVKNTPVLLLRDSGRRENGDFPPST